MERTQTRGISRRSFIGGMTGAGALAALGLAGCAPKAAGSAEADKLSETGAQGVADNSVVAVDDGSAAITVDWLARRRRSPRATSLRRRTPTCSSWARVTAA